MPLYALRQFTLTGAALAASGSLLLTGCYIDNNAAVKPWDDSADVSQVQTTIATSCAKCEGEADLSILWEGSEAVEGYVIYYGPQPDTATRVIGGGPAENIFTVPLTVTAGEQMCFRITAYTDNIESDYSPAVCIEEVFRGV